MNYIELSIRCADSMQSEITTACLSDFPFDSFCEEDGQLKAYIRRNDYSEHRDEIESYLRGSGLEYTKAEIPDQNWNALWESNFEPIDVENRCRIRAPFHAKNPDSEYDIEIMPKMSFGTGHHATTYLMAAEIMEHNLSGQRGLDMGSGTAVLAILAAMRGAVHVDAVDIDEWAYENGMENIATNGMVGRITPQLGDAGLLAGRRYDFVLANINRNILLADMKAYADTLSTGGTLIVSGILEADTEMIGQEAEQQGFECLHMRTRAGWAAMRFAKR